MGARRRGGRMKQFEYLENYYLEPGESYSTKFLKIVEEYGELKESVEEGKTHSHTAQEVLDLMLTCVNFLKRMEKDEFITIGTEVYKHSVKLNKYLETGKYKK